MTLTQPFLDLQDPQPAGWSPHGLDPPALGHLRAGGRPVLRRASTMRGNHPTDPFLDVVLSASCFPLWLLLLLYLALCLAIKGEEGEVRMTRVKRIKLERRRLEQKVLNQNQASEWVCSPIADVWN